MHNFEVGSTGGPAPYGSQVPDGPHRNSVLSLVLLIGTIVVVASIALGLVLWTVGLVFSLAGVILRVLILTAVVALVWRYIARRRSCRHI